MKDQYFGDVNDYRKYAVLRSLVIPDRLRIGVCWMLTEPDGNYGHLRTYLDKPETYRHCDPDLFDWLKIINAQRARRTAQIESAGLLGESTFHSSILTDSESERRTYFAECFTRFAGCDLVFFDPDNGLEVRSVLRGRKYSCRYLYWDEVCNTFTKGSSILIYQHFPREKRESFAARMAEQLGARTGATEVFSLATPHVLFLLASQERHTAVFRERLESVRSTFATVSWPAEHSQSKRPPPPNARL